MSNIDSEADRIRQSERTVDNLKRLYAVLFALSFGLLAQGSAAKLTSALGGQSWTLRDGLLHFEVTVVFALTAGLFYYQSDRFLDVALARRPLPDVSAGRFAFDYLVNVITMAPFYAMAFSLSLEVSRSSLGFTGYFLAYVLLIANGLFWLFVRSSASFVLKLGAPSPEIQALNAFWKLMNSALLLAIVFLYRWFDDRAGLCVAGQKDDNGFAFVAILGLVIIVRDTLDFWHGWPVLYPVRNMDEQVKKRGLLQLLKAHPGVRLVASWTAVGLTAASLYFLWETGVLASGALSAACAP